MSNCKPPLMIWCIVLGGKLFGFSELSLRLPSALAALFLCIYLYITLKKYTGNEVFGFFTVMILVTSQGYIRNHVTRTGEYDSVLVLFSTLFSLHLFFACEAVEKKEQSRYLFGFFVFLTFAVLTKGIACLMQVPGLFIYAVLRKKIVPFLKNKWAYAGLVFFLIFGLGYYFLRETINPGYIKAVWENELGGRFSGVLEHHKGAFTMYMSELVSWQFAEYIFLFPVALIIGLLFSQSRIRKLVLFSSLVGSTFLIVVSSASTKLGHYEAPLIPYLAMITASLFIFLYDAVKNSLSNNYKPLISTLLSFFLIISLFLYPYSHIISKVYFPKGDPWEEGFSVSCKYFQDAAKGNLHEVNCKLIFDTDSIGPGSVIACYQQELKEHYINNEIIRHDQVKVNDKVIVFDPYLKQLINQKFVTEEVHSLPFCNGDVIYIKCEK